jgi:transcriptional regulator with XRE-family HTH domain
MRPADSPAIQRRPEAPAVPDSLGQALREARRNSGLSFSWFARQAGYSESHLRSVENGHRAVTDDVAAAYDRALATGGEFAAALALAGDAGAPVPWNQSHGTVRTAGRHL